MNKYATEQEAFWAGEFGTDYTERNASSKLRDAKLAMWSRVLSPLTGSVTSATELGCNQGLNLSALRAVDDQIRLVGVEINASAAARASSLGIAEIVTASALDKLELTPADLVFTAGVLIHINPDFLPQIYSNLVSLSRRYVLVAEYYNPQPVEVAYRGHSGRLFKRDFAGELMDGFGLKLLDYGFCYHRDPIAPLDDITWFLMEKPQK